MKKLFLLSLVVCVAQTGCKKQPAGEALVDENVPMDLPAEAFEPEFESVEYGFRVKGPEGWVKQADSLGMLVTYLKPGNPDSFQENITIARELKPEGSNLELYAAETRDKVLAYFEGAELKGENESMVGGLAAKKFRFVLTVDDLVLETEQIVLERSSEFMVFTFMSLPEQFPGAFPEFNKLIESVEFVGTEMPA